MSASSNRLLKPELLPPELWNNNYQEEGASEHGLVRLASCLADAYRRLIDQFGLSLLAGSRDPINPPLGGLTQAQTDKHFAQAFDGSCARTQLALMDPFNLATKASNNLVRALSGNKVAFVDIPCGAGAAAFSLLTTIAQLRESSVLPREPLDIHLVGGEISAPARIYAEALAKELTPALESQAITLTFEFRAWDVTDELSTADFVRRMNVGADGRTRRLLVIANFNGFLIMERKQKAAQPQLKQLLIHSSGDDSYAVWIEPYMKRATGQGGVFDWLRSLLLISTWTKFAREEVEDGATEATPICCSRFELPLNPGNTARVGLSLMPLDLKRQP